MCTSSSRSRRQCFVVCRRRQRTRRAAHCRVARDRSAARCAAESKGGKDYRRARTAADRATRSCVPLGRRRWQSVRHGSTRSEIAGATERARRLAHLGWRGGNAAVLYLPNPLRNSPFVDRMQAAFHVGSACVIILVTMGRATIPLVVTLAVCYGIWARRSEWPPSKSMIGVYS